MIAFISPYSVVIFYQSTPYQKAKDGVIMLSLIAGNNVQSTRYPNTKDPRLTDNLVHSLPHIVIKLGANVQGLCKDNGRLLAHDFSQCTYFFGT